MINYGSLLDPDTINSIEDHTIPISIDNVYQKTLTLDDIDSFFITLLDMQNIGKTAQKPKENNSPGCDKNKDDKL